MLVVAKTTLSLSFISEEVSLGQFDPMAALGLRAV